VTSLVPFVRGRFLVPLVAIDGVSSIVVSLLAIIVRKIGFIQLHLGCVIQLLAIVEKLHQSQ
jgi:hypothetical protein